MEDPLDPEVCAILEAKLRDGRITAGHAPPFSNIVIISVLALTSFSRVGEAQTRAEAQSAAAATPTKHTLPGV
jgi:hypothetical protein